MSQSPAPNEQSTKAQTARKRRRRDPSYTPVQSIETEEESSETTTPRVTRSALKDMPARSGKSTTLPRPATATKRPRARPKKGAARPRKVQKRNRLKVSKKSTATAIDNSNPDENLDLDEDAEPALDSFYTRLPLDEVWHRHMPSRFPFGETPWIAARSSRQIRADLARGMSLLFFQITCDWQ